MLKIQINSEYVNLGQFLQIINVSSSGGESKILVKELEILVNNEKENRRGRKLYKNDIIKILGEEYLIQ